MTAKSRYDYLASDRSQYLNVAEQCSRLTLPYLIREDEDTSGRRVLNTPWQSVGAKGVVTLASKLMLALLPPQTSFFKLQVNDSQLGQEIPDVVRSELDLSFSKIERMMNDSIAASSDRVVVHQAIKHLVVGGNALLYMGKNNLKVYPLNRYVVDRDGNGNVVEIVTKEKIHHKLLGKFLDTLPNGPAAYKDSDEELDVYTHIKRDNNRYVWHQEVFDKIVPGSAGKAPIETNPWLALRFNTVDGEAYGRGRVEEFLADLKSLDALMQALVEGSAVAAKVVFTVNPSSTTKPQTLASAGNGAIIQGRPDDIAAISVGKTADFRTAYEMVGVLERRLSEAFLILNVRNSERTTAEEVRMTQMELEQQLGGLFSLLTVEFLVPYLNRKLDVAQRSGDIPRLPKGIVRPTIVAGVNALGRGQDRESLTAFLTTIAQTLGPESLMNLIDPTEAVRRLAASQGIDVLNLVRSEQELQAQQQQAMEQQQELELTKQASSLASVPALDPSKNPNLVEQQNGEGNTQPTQAGQEVSA